MCCFRQQPQGTQDPPQDWLCRCLSHPAAAPSVAAAHPAADHPGLVLLASPLSQKRFSCRRQRLGCASPCRRPALGCRTSWMCPRVRIARCPCGTEGSQTTARPGWLCCRPGAASPLPPIALLPRTWVASPQFDVCDAAPATGQIPGQPAQQH